MVQFHQTIKKHALNFAELTNLPMANQLNFPPIDFSTIKRVLVIKLRYHGDVLLCSPVFSTMKHHYPHLDIDALIYEETVDMLSLHPSIDQIHTIDRKWRNMNPYLQLKHESGVISKLRDRQYDLIIHLTEHWRGFYLKHLLGAQYAVTADYARRVKNRLWQRTFTHIYSVPKDRNKAASHIDALRCLGIQATEQEEMTCLSISDKDRQHVAQLLTARNLNKGEFILIHPTSRFFYKCCPPEIMTRVVSKLTKQGKKIVITAAPSAGEAKYIELMV